MLLRVGATPLIREHDAVHVVMRWCLVRAPLDLSPLNLITKFLSPMAANSCVSLSEIYARSAPLPSAFSVPCLKFAVGIPSIPAEAIVIMLERGADPECAGAVAAAERSRR